MMTPGRALLGSSGTGDPPPGESGQHGTSDDTAGPSLMAILGLISKGIGAVFRSSGILCW